MVERRMNPLECPQAPSGHVVRHATGVTHWPKGLHWFAKRLGRRPKLYATYTIKARGRNGAKSRQALMAHASKFVVDVSERVRP
jgi:hypothetical protein